MDYRTKFGFESLSHRELMKGAIIPIVFVPLGYWIVSTAFDCFSSEK